MKMKLPIKIKGKKIPKGKIAAVLAAVLALTGFAAFAGNKPLPIETVTVEAGEVKTWFSETGTVTTGEEYLVYSAASGNVSQVYVEKGQYVEMGTVIAQLDTASYQAEIAIHNANIRSYQAEGNLSSAGYSVEQLGQQVDYSRQQLATYTGLYEAGAISQNEYEGYEQEHAVLQTSLDQAVNQRSGTQSSYGALAEGEQAAIALLQNQIANCTIKAGRSGYITSLPVANQSYIQAQSPVCVIQDQKGLLVEAYVATEDIASVQLGEQVELVQELRNEEISYAGTVVEIGQWAEEQVSALGVTEQRVKVVIAPAEELSAANGYSVTVRFTSFYGAEAIALPKTAFFEHAGQDWVFVVGDDGMLQAVPVEKGPTSQGQTVAMSGLSSGTVVVRDASAEGVQEGVQVSW